MDFSLSSSLVGSAVLNPDKLSLDLQFATDKTLTARVQVLESSITPLVS
jgi:hypothetical protein